VALKAKTGEYVWHFQEVHHDIRDYDATSPVVLFDSCTAATMCIGCNDLPDHLVGAGEQRRRHFQANRLRHDQVNDEVELGRLLDMKATVLTAVENSYFS
jgi:hypothetical protein